VPGAYKTRVGPNLITHALARCLRASLLVTLVPEVGGWKTKWHEILTGLSAIFLIAMILIIAFSPFITLQSRVVSGLGFLTMLGIALYHLFLSDKKEPKNQLLLQSGFYGTFYLVILFVAYSV
jgi:hypothetical protein